MLDQYGRTIEYMRISITDRCNLRCRYCMPEGVACESHDDILRYEEILRIARAAAALGISRFKITGGEPLVRKGCAGLIEKLKAMPGVEQVTLTTNGLLLRRELDALCTAGLDAVNISLDTLDTEKFQRITGYDRFSEEELRALLSDCVTRGLRTKLNTVLLEENRDEAVPLAALAGDYPVDLRFIELMPIGYGGTLGRVSPDEVLDILRKRWPDLRPTEEKRGNGPAHYYRSDALQGRIGFIDAVSHAFCADCNRVRLTSTGQLKPCLSFDSTADLRALLRSGCTDAELTKALHDAIYSKPRAHSFDRREKMTERRIMSQIGG